MRALRLALFGSGRCPTGRHEQRNAFSSTCPMHRTSGPLPFSRAPRSSAGSRWWRPWVERATGPPMSSLRVRLARPLDEPHGTAGTTRQGTGSHLHARHRWCGSGGGAPRPGAPASRIPPLCGRPEDAGHPERAQRALEHRLRVRRDMGPRGASKVGDVPGPARAQPLDRTLRGRGAHERRLGLVSPRPEQRDAGVGRSGAPPLSRRRGALPRDRRRASSGGRRPSFTFPLLAGARERRRWCGRRTPRTQAGAGRCPSPGVQRPRREPAGRS